MKRFLAFVLIAALGIFTIGCESKKDTTENKTEETTTHTMDGMTMDGTMDGMMNSTDTKTKGTTPTGDMMTEKTTETTK